MSVELLCSAADEVIDGSGLYYLRHMGSSFTHSTLALDKQDRMWVIKPLMEHTANGLANELLGSTLCRALGIPSPECKKILIEDHYFDNPETWLETARGKCKPQPGLHLACRYLPDSENIEVMEFLPPHMRSKLANRYDCLKMIVFDVWANHLDRRQAFFYERRGDICVTFFDHSHLFGGPAWDRGGSCYATADYVQRVAAEQYKDPEVGDVICHMQQVLPNAFEQLIPQIPRRWYDGDILALSVLYRKRLRSLHFLLAEVMCLVRQRTESVLKAERRVVERDKDYFIRLLSQRGTDLWL